MAITFVGAGALATTTVTNSISVSCHANVAVGDILIACLIQKSATLDATSPPDGTWTKIIEDVNDCTTAADDHQFAVYWKRATSAGAQAFSFTRTGTSNLFAGVIGAWAGAKASGSPLDATAATANKTGGANDTVGFDAYDPTSTNVHVIYVAFYGNDATTFAAAMSNDTNPDCTIRWDLETGSGNDATIACTSGDNDGSNIASRTWASNSSVDSGSTGVVFALVAGLAPLTAGGGSYAVTGTAGSLERGYKAAAGGGSYAISGTTASLERGYEVVANGGSYAVTGADATFDRTYILSAGGGSYAITGADASLEFGREVVAGGGSYIITGADASLVHEAGGEIILSAEGGTYTISGTTASLEADRKITAEAGSYAVNGTDAALERGFEVLAGGGSYAISGGAASLEADREIIAGIGSYAVSGSAVTLQALRELIAESEIYFVSGTNAALSVAAAEIILLPGEAGSYLIDGSPASLVIVTGEYDYPSRGIYGNYGLRASRAKLRGRWPR